MLVKVFLINFFLIMAPIGILIHFLGKLLLNAGGFYDEKFLLFYLTIIIVALTIFQETFKSKESTFFANYSEEFVRPVFR